MSTTDGKDVNTPLTPNDRLLLSGLIPSNASLHRLRRLVHEQGSSIDWKAISQRGAYHFTLPLLRYNLAQARLLPHLPKDFSETMERESQLWAAREMALINESRSLIVALQTRGVRSLPLKGAALMLGRYYPTAGLRPAVDLDLLVSPEEVAAADQILERLGYAPLPGERMVRPKQRLANEQNHLWPRRGPTGLIVELHHRAFHCTPGARDLHFAEMWENARPVETDFIALPSPADLALHLIHHTIVDLQSGQSILRTVSDLFFIFKSGGDKVMAELFRRGRDFGIGGAVLLARDAVHHLQEANLEALDVDVAHPELAFLIETSLLDSHARIANAARIVEYLSLLQRPLQKIPALVSLLFPARGHMEQLYHQPDLKGRKQQGRASMGFNYLRRPFDLLRKIDWQSLEPDNLRRVFRWRRIGKEKKR